MCKVGLGSSVRVQKFVLAFSQLHLKITRENTQTNKPWDRLNNDQIKERFPITHLYLEDKLKCGGVGGGGTATVIPNIGTTHG
jgi:hypothetical protein